MTPKTLVVIPCLQHKYMFSAPLAWLFSHCSDLVHGVYSFSLDAQTVRQYDQFIVELNWFIELYEFQLIVAFIKKHNPKAPILFGGLYSQLKYPEVFRNSPVDLFIKGDAEVPIRQFVEGVDPRKIPNMVGRGFENPQTYVFQQAEYQDIDFNLDWFPDYQKRWAEFPYPGADVDPDFSQMPLRPQYQERNAEKLPPALRWRVPPKGGLYHLPMLITARGSCPAAHTGCEYCMGARPGLSEAIYKRPPLVMDNDTCIRLLRKVEKRFDQVSLYINSQCDYDFTGEQFDLEATIEIDAKSTVEDARKILPAFRKACLHTALYEDGLIGQGIRTNLDQYHAIEDEDHKVYFFAFPQDAANHQIPENRRLYSELILPPWTHWDFYTDWKRALARSRSWYFMTGQVNFYPFPRQFVMRVVRFGFQRLAYVLNRLKLIDLKKKYVV